MRITPILIGLLMIPASAASAATPDDGAIIAPAAIAAEITQAIPEEPQIAVTPATDSGSVEDTDLTDLRGGEALTLANQTLLTISQGNSIAGNYTAGNVTLSDNALSNFAGVGNVVINTGAQANLQAGMNLIINLIP